MTQDSKLPCSVLYSTLHCRTDHHQNPPNTPRAHVSPARRQRNVSPPRPGCSLTRYVGAPFPLRCCFLMERTETLPPRRLANPYSHKG